MLDINHLHVLFNQGSVDERMALHDLSLHVDDGDFISILGSNGAGKSTLFNSICGSIPILKGSILLDTIDIARFNEHQRCQSIGRLFQDPLRGSAPHLSIEENLALADSRGRHHAMHFAINHKKREAYQKLLASLDMGLENRLQQSVGLLSGGQRQALTLLMATLVTPKLLLLDEHTAALDPHSAHSIMDLSQSIIHKDKITTLMITHNIKQALAYGNKTIILHQGNIIRTLDIEEKRRIKVEDVLKMYEL